MKHIVRYSKHLGQRSQSGCRQVVRPCWRLCPGFVSLGIIAGALSVTEISATQVPAHAHLTDPHAVVLATETTQAGEFTLDSFPVTWLGQQYSSLWGYVPEQCVGTRRCPLLVVLPSANMMKFLRPAVDNYGFILLMVSGVGSRKTLQNAFDQGRRPPGLDRLDYGLRQVFQRFAIDPDKIALMGRCASGSPTAFLIPVPT